MGREFCAHRMHQADRSAHSSKHASARPLSCFISIQPPGSPDDTTQAAHTAASTCWKASRPRSSSDSGPTMIACLLMVGQAVHSRQYTGSPACLSARQAGRRLSGGAQRRRRPAVTLPVTHHASSNARIRVLPPAPKPVPPSPHSLATRVRDLLLAAHPDDRAACTQHHDDLHRTTPPLWRLKQRAAVPAAPSKVLVASLPRLLPAVQPPRAARSGAAGAALLLPRRRACCTPRCSAPRSAASAQPRTAKAAAGGKRAQRTFRQHAGTAAAEPAAACRRRRRRCQAPPSAYRGSSHSVQCYIVIASRTGLWVSPRRLGAF